jgi:hypothetical protein
MKTIEKQEINTELLEALRSVIDQLEGIGIPDWHGAEGLYLDDARAAISKAERKSSVHDVLRAKGWKIREVKP